MMYLGLKEEKIMKKTKLMLAAGLLAFSVFSGLEYNTEKAMASQQVDCEMNNAEGKPGDTVTVTIKVTSNPGTIMSETRFAYDSDVVEITNVTEKDMFRTADIGNVTSDYVAPNLAKNPIQLINGFQSYSGNSKNTGDLYVIELKIKDDAKIGESEIKFTGTFCDWEFNDYSVNCNTAKIKVICEHKDVKEVEDKAPTCTEKGSNKKVCNICGETIETVEVDAAGHKFGEWTTSKEATCTGTGEETRVCSVCDNKETRTVDALGHKFGEWSASKEATCTEAGTDKRVCAACGKEETRDVAALGHKVDEWTITKEPTYTEEGSKEGKCSRCDEIITEVIKTIPATEIVSADEMFANYDIADDTKVLDAEGNELSENKLQLKATELKDVDSAKTSINAFAKEGMELKDLTVYQIKLVTNTDGIEVNKLDKAMTITMKVPTEYTAAGEVYVLGTDGNWAKVDLEMVEGTITFQMIETQTYAFVNFGEVEKSVVNNNDNKLNDDEKTEESKSDKKISDTASDSSKETSNNNSNTKKDVVQTGDTAVGGVFVMMMLVAGVATVLLKKKQDN
jgi:hypothetical protein